MRYLRLRLILKSPNWKGIIFKITYIHGSAKDKEGRNTFVVLLNGGGFGGPEWSVRVSLANLEDEDYSITGKKIAETMQEYVDAWKNKEK
jgi:hypothetical protein